jgi:hypothetical protein
VTNGEPCTRCGGKISERMPAEGRTRAWRWLKKVTTVTTVEHVFRFAMNRWNSWAEDPSDRVRQSYTDLHVCDPCADEIWKFATADLERQRLEKATRRRDRAQAEMESIERKR